MSSTPSKKSGFLHENQRRPVISRIIPVGYGRTYCENRQFHVQILKKRELAIQMEDSVVRGRQAITERLKKTVAGLLHGCEILPSCLWRTSDEQGFSYMAGEAGIIVGTSVHDGIQLLS